MWKKLLFSALLFYVLTPGVFLSLRTPLTSVPVTHAIVFALVSGFVWKGLKKYIMK
jgi:hypothetical protein